MILKVRDDPEISDSCEVSRKEFHTAPNCPSSFDGLPTDRIVPVESDYISHSHEGKSFYEKFQQSRKVVAAYVESEGKSCPTFMIFITVCIVLNTLFLALDRYPIDEKSATANEMANFIFYLIFLFEMILKLYGLGVKQYCRDSFNIFDGVIVILSTIEVILANSGVGGSGGNAISAFRAVRLLRLFKLAKSWKSLRDLLVTIQ